MPSIADSAVIFILALMLFGPKKLPQLARQLGKLMAEFRRASNEFRMQMEDELRIEEQKEHQKKVDAMAGPPSTLPDPEHPHLPPPIPDAEPSGSAEGPDHASVHDGTAPIAESGSLRMMPPSTGLPVERTAYGTSSPVDESFAHDAAAHTNGTYSNGDAHGAIPEHSIMPPEPPVGMSSEEPAAEAKPAEDQTHA